MKAPFLYKMGRNDRHRFYQVNNSATAVLMSAETPVGLNTT